MEQNYPNWFLRSDRIIVRIYKAIAYIGVAALFAIMLIAFVDVIGEKLGKAGLPVSGIASYNNWIAYLHVVVVFCTCGLVTLDRGHTCVDILTNHLPKAIKKVTAYLSMVLGALVGGYMCYRGFFGLLPDAWAHHTTITSSSYSFPQWPFILVYSIGCGLLCFSFLWAIVRLAVGFELKPVDAFAAEGDDKES
jgi:TRAP-type C4-dicarboxylate transport system permease small subunit